MSDNLTTEELKSIQDIKTLSELKNIIKLFTKNRHDIILEKKKEETRLFKLEKVQRKINEEKKYQDSVFENKTKYFLEYLDYKIKFPSYPSYKSYTPTIFTFSEEEFDIRLRNFNAANL